MEATNPLSLQADSLAGDIRTPILALLQDMNEPWTKLSQYEQQRRIDAAQKIARDAVRGAVKIVGERGFPSLEGTTGKWSVKDGVIKLEVTCAATSAAITALAMHGSGLAVLALANPGVYFGERAEAVAQLDQPELPIERDATTAEASATVAGEGTGAGTAGAESGAGGGEAAPLGSIAERAVRKVRRGPSRTSAMAALGKASVKVAAGRNPSKPPKLPADPQAAEPVA